MLIIPTNLILYILVYPIRLIFVKWCQGDGVVDNFFNTDGFYVHSSSETKK